MTHDIFILKIGIEPLCLQNHQFPLFVCLTIVTIEELHFYAMLAALQIFYRCTRVCTECVNIKNKVGEKELMSTDRNPACALSEDADAGGKRRL